jgi:hypothetical protein
MVRLLAALVVLGAALAPVSNARAFSTMCTEQSFVSFADESEAEQDVPMQPAAVPAPLRDEELPWCTSAADPRCSPINGNSSPASAGLRQPAAIHVDMPATDLVSAAEFEFTPQLGLHPSAGEGSRVERPPRAARRSL